MTSATRLGRGATIYDVAQRALVSAATVSRVMRGTAPVSPATRERVEEAVRALSFVPNRLGISLAEGRHAANGIVFPALSGPYYAEVVLGYEEAAGELDRSVIILSTHGRTATRERVLALASRVDGLVVLGRTVDDDVIEEVLGLGTPVVTLARPPVGVPARHRSRHADPVDRTDSVCADNAGSGRALAEHVLAHGVREVVLLGDPAGSADVASRWAALEDAFAGQARTRQVRSHGFDVAAGRHAATALLRHGRPEAVVAHNDEVALGVIEAAGELGVDVPRDLIVTGWDDVMAARWAGLTTVRQPMRELGERAARLLDARIRGDDSPPRHEVLATHLVQRRTCGRHEEEP